MRRFLAIAVCGLSVGACTSTDVFKFESKPPTANLQLESVPPGAEAKLSTGQACRTPCSLPVTTDAKEVTVSYALEGYQPEAVQVDVIAPQSFGDTVHVNPNPVSVDLEKAPPVVVKKRRAVVHERTVVRPATVTRKTTTVVRKPTTVVEKPKTVVEKPKTTVVKKRVVRRPRPVAKPKPAAVKPAPAAPAPAAPPPASSGSAPPSVWGPPPQPPTLHQ